MPERERYIPGVPCWVDTSQPDPAAATEFYRGLFGWDFEDAMPEGSGAHYFMGRIRGGDVAAVGSVPPGSPPEPMWNTYVSVDSADKAVARARDAGGEAMDAFDVMDAGRMAVITDPEGATLCVWEPKQNPGARVVNEHGSLNFNTLATRDIEGAKAFYGSLFGWQLLSIPSGPMWALPAYGDHLEETTPGLREQMVQMGAPDGFIDVVAALAPIAEGDTSTPARWSVTFAVDDIDAIADKAKELGGQVVEGPTDLPWSRQATIEDPQGATFIASQFIPENADIEG
jgi:predicted enzyme related to lactoylglutathione lyase